jgi:hypothetical protein
MRFLPGALALVACAPGSSPPPPGAATVAEARPQADSLRGTVEIVGSEPGTWVALLPQGVTLTGERRLLQQLAGLEVAVFGTRDGPKQFTVQRFAVRAASGVPAVDGVLDHGAGGWVLVTADGVRRPVPRLPEALRGKAGARVWIAGPLDRPDSFGIIAEAGQ